MVIYLENRIKMMCDYSFKHIKGWVRKTKLFFCNFGRLEKMNSLVFVDHKEVFPDHGGDT